MVLTICAKLGIQNTRLTIIRFGGIQHFRFSGINFHGPQALARFEKKSFFVLSVIYFM
ncbi:hypothetical protein LCGC14_2867630 [marine sediment metagenome]|uniref:Uncharacterized protein n=1 Tax=marine sediment metagenome TaxID=412755 RepID=A0A0F8Y3P6_9ZZZZ